MKKRLSIIFIVFMLLILFTYAVTQEEGGPEEFPTSGSNTLGSATFTNQGPVKSGSATAGTTITNTGTGYKFSPTLTSAITTSGAQLSNCRDAFISNGGDITASSCNYFSFDSIQLGDSSNLNFQATDTLTVDSASRMLIESPVKIYIENIGRSVFNFKDNKLQSFEISMKEKNTTYLMRNPIALQQGRFAEIETFKDTDSDGLADSFEGANGLNANSKDTDGDALTDYEEIMKYPTDPKKADIMQQWHNQRASAISFS